MALALRGREAVDLGVRIIRDDGEHDQLAGRCFASYDEAYDELERYYADLCCSDDRIFYRIVPLCSAQ
ncbi:MAG: hypothetical protein ACO3B2_01825 [Vulcanococcus sp.]